MVNGIRRLPQTAWILALAFAVRMAAALLFPNIIAPDEVFQFLEQAHRLVFGQGIVPWEFQVGLRSWLIPLMLSGPMALAHMVFANPLAGLVFIRILLVLASLPIVWTATKWGGRFYGAQGAWIAGIFTALWPDLWLMAPHPLEEVLAADILVPAIYLVETCGARASLRRVFVIGFMLGSALTLRIQIAPAIAIAGIALCGGNIQRWRTGLLAGALPLLANGLLDWIAWGEPFRSLWLNIYLNLFLGIAKDQFGTSPAGYFIYMMGLDWLWTLPALLFLCWRGGKHLPVAGYSALAIFITHNLISHKEYRFIFPAIALAIPLAGVGLAGIWTYLRKNNQLNAPRTILGAFLLMGPICSPWIYFMLDFQTNSFQIFEDVANQRPHLVSVEGLEHDFTASDVNVLPIDLVLGKSTRLTRETVISSPSGPIEADAIVAAMGTMKIPGDFTKQACFSGGWIPFATKPKPQVCVWIRQGAAPPAGNAPPFVFPFPEQAKPFIIPDRLLG
jgi:phosphatidylinositol glycan class B